MHVPPHFTRATTSPVGRRSISSTCSSFCVVGFTTDIPHLSNWGTPLLLGPGSIHDAHGAGERMAKAELERGVELYVRLARQLLGLAAGAER